VLDELGREREAEIDQLTVHLRDPAIDPRS
jgi:hypothetical protein